MDAVPPGGLGGTFGGNPLACAAAIAVLDEVADAGFRAARRRRSATRLRTRLDEIAARQPASARCAGSARCSRSSSPSRRRTLRGARHRGGARARARPPLVRPLRQRHPDPRRRSSPPTRSSTAGSTILEESLGDAGAGWLSGRRGRGAPDVRLAGVRKTYGDVVAVDGVDLDVARGRVLHAARPVGLGQDDDAAPDRRLRAPRRRAHRARRARRHARRRRTSATSTPSSRTTRSSRT